MAFQPPRGIAPELLISQVKNTAPYLFLNEEAAAPLISLEPLQFLRKYYAQMDSDPAHLQSPKWNLNLSHLEYYKLCLCSHFLSCATPVPTDVDQQIRFKLFHEKLPLETTLEMSELILESRSWDFRGISKRFVYGAPETSWATQILSGHQGEWFTVACAAYSALSRSKDSAATQKSQEILSQIMDEIEQHSEIFASLWSAQDGLQCLQASALIAHNLGDLDRAMDLWELSSIDPLRTQLYQLTSQPLNSQGKLRYRGRLWVAGELYKSEILGSSMAAENHRHYALRKPRVLRQDPRFLIPLGPFFDDWGQTVAQTLALESSLRESLQEVSEALAQGWARLRQPVGYGRALCGILRETPELRGELPTLDTLLKLKKNRKLMEMSQGAFESLWNLEALKKMEEIPSRL